MLNRQQPPNSSQPNDQKGRTQQEKPLPPLTSLARTKVIPEAMNRHLASMWNAKEPLTKEAAFFETATQVVKSLSDQEARELLAKALSWASLEELREAEKRQKKMSRKSHAETDSTG